VVTDEFLTVLNGESKSLAVEVWKRVLKPGGKLITTAMIGRWTTEDLRRKYADRASKLLASYARILFADHDSSNEKASRLMHRINKFAALHTRHMIRDENELLTLLDGFKDVVMQPVETPGECVNPTFSFQITARAPSIG
jgi:ubiquinone/menaquinone biosynthesis C-methylase UbiE